MSGPWIVAFVALWAVVLLIALVVLGVLRRVTNVLEDAEARAAARPSADLSGAPPGTEIPDFHVRTRDGELVASTDLLDADALVLFVESGCGPCDALVRQLGPADALIEGIRLIVIADDSDAARQWRLPEEIAVLYQRERSASRAFRNLALPQAFLVAAPGVVRSRSFATSVTGLRALAREASPGPHPAETTDGHLTVGGIA